MKYKFITIEGNIGAGKTSLAIKLAEELNGKLILEQFADNPFLPKFYENPKRYAFPLELFFLAERHQQLKNNLTEQDIFRQFTITDYLFVKSLLFAKINLEEEEYKLYSNLFNIIHQTLPKPDLLIYLHCTVEKLLENIKKRGREYEQSIQPEYLHTIQNAYFDFFKTRSDWRILLVDMGNINFVENKKHFTQITGLLNKDFDLGINYFP